MYTSDLAFDLAVTRISHVVERVTAADWTLNIRQGSPSFVLCLALEGKAEYTLASGDVLPVTGGDVLFFTSGIHRRARTMPDAPWRFITVIFDVHIYSPQAEQQLMLLPALTPGAAVSLRTAFQELESVWSGKRAGYILRCRSLIEQILWELMHAADTTHDSVHYQNIERVRAHLQSHFRETFSVSDLAAMARCSPSHFRTLFRQIVGMTATQYQTMVRMEKAKDLLLSGEFNVSETAAYLGYRDIYYFSRQFKSVVGVPPREFRG